MQAVQTELAEKILVAISAKSWTKVDELWKQVLAADPQPFSFHKPFIDRLIRREEGERFTKLYQPLINQALAAESADLPLAILEYSLAIDERHEWMRLPLIRSLQKVYGESVGPRFAEMIERSGLQQENSSLRRGLVKFEDMLGATKGQVFQHNSWGLGVVKELNAAEGKVVIDFQLKPRQTLTLDGVRQYLQRIPKDHILARIARDPEELRERLKSDPAEVLKLGLHSYKGRIKVADLKKILTTRFLKEEEYKTFWNDARKAIKLDPWIDQVGAGVNSELVLRAQPRSFFEEIFSQILTAKTVEARREVLRDVRRHGSDAEMTEQDREALFQLYLKPVADHALQSEAERLNHGLLFEEFEDLFPGKGNPVNVAALLKGPNAAELTAQVEVHELRRLALEHLREHHAGQWTELWVEVVVDMDSRTVAWMEKELKSGGEEDARQRALERIIARPDANPDLFLWAARNILEALPETNPRAHKEEDAKRKPKSRDSWSHLHESIPPIMICEELLSLLAQLDSMAQAVGPENEAVASIARSSATKIRGLLNENNSRLFKRAVAFSTVEEGRRMLQNVRLHDALSAPLKAQLEAILINQHEDLRRVSRSEEEEERKKPTYHYTSRSALDKQRSLLAKLVGVEVPGMAKVIEAARELGDLRENSEYHAAKDRQKLLMQQAAELEDLIARARVVEAREVEPDSTRFGTRVRIRDLATKEVKDVTLAGMWESNVEKNIISYLTPFGSQLLNRRVGESFQLTTLDGRQTSYEVLEIATALTPSGDWT